MTTRRIRQGDIFWLDDCEPLHGDGAKRRPVVVVVSPDQAMDASPHAIIVACTSIALPSNVAAVEFPSRERTPQTRTGLKRRTWAVPEWLLPVERRLLVDYVGFVPRGTLRRLLEAVAKAHGASE